MARIPSAPPFPDRPGAWLANFRYRAQVAGGQRLSPELLGYHLGVSGATVRRWEAGVSEPSEDDLRRLAEVCRLNPVQREFLLRAYARNHARPEAAPENFYERATQLLSIPRPAFIVDELHYVRAWNNYVGVIRERNPVCMKEGTHLLHIVLMPRPDYRPEVDRERSLGYVRLFWLWTAELCSLPAYASTLRELAANRVFRDCWLSLAEPDARATPAPADVPFDEAMICSRRYRIYTTETYFPPNYRVFVYEPADAAARKLVCALEKVEEPRVSFARAVHWSQEPAVAGA